MFMENLIVHGNILLKNVNSHQFSRKTIKGLSQIQLFRLCTIPQMQSFVQNMDFAFYQVVVEVLVPDVLNPNMSSKFFKIIEDIVLS